MKNVIVLAWVFAKVANYGGDNSKASIMTRGLAGITAWRWRYGEAATMSGLAGMGD